MAFSGYSGSFGSSGFSGVRLHLPPNGEVATAFNESLRNVADELRRLAVLGVSGYSGASGARGEPGDSGGPGSPGPSGIAGVSGKSGYSGASGYSGFSGLSGATGGSGLSGLSGYSGLSGSSGASGSPGLQGDQGGPGVQGTSGTSGKSGTSGTSGRSGYSGVSGYSGTQGSVGLSGISGYSGALPSTPSFSSLTVTGDSDLQGLVTAGNNPTGVSGDYASLTIGKDILAASTKRPKLRIYGSVTDNTKDYVEIGLHYWGWVQFSKSVAASSFIGPAVLNGNQNAVINTFYQDTHSRGGMYFTMRDDGAGTVYGGTMSPNFVFITNQVNNSINTCTTLDLRSHPTLVLYSANADSDWTRNFKLWHDGTNAQLVSGSGAIKQTAPGGVIFTPQTVPSSPVEGQTYMDSTTHKLRVYNGTAWNDCW